MHAAAESVLLTLLSSHGSRSGVLLQTPVNRDCFYRLPKDYTLFLLQNTLQNRVFDSRVLHMAMELQKPKVTELPKKTLETSPQSPSLAQRLDSSAASTLRLSSENASAVEEPRKDGVEGKENKEIALSSPTSSIPISDLQKKFRRAERFGVPVQLSEAEKRNSRAERFGTATTICGSMELKKLEEQKRKARAERFGFTSQPTVDEEAKKKARFERFAQGPKLDPLEDDKRKARAARFGEASTGNSSEANGKANPELKTDAPQNTGGA
ncbi:protein MODIFIER OF SNC1 11-like [Aristolochia californica]|uniref:protein MODIFIER OF SNC1 11-like n=1 Tax=Aristolochia californica TaxID=171875 RepID=UPI0035DBED5E